MAAQYSILKYVPNPISGEAIAVGLLVVQANTNFFCYSRQKLELCSRIAPESVSLFRLYLKSFHALLGNQHIAGPNQLFQSEPTIAVSKLTDFSKYHNGVVQFSAPAFIEKTFNREDFEQFYCKVIGSYPEESGQHITHANGPGLVSKVHRHFKQVLSEQADIDYTIHKGQLPNLYFDFKLDAAAYNGKMYSAKAVDFNRHKAREAIEKTLVEYEALVQRLDELSEKKGLAEGEYWLVADPYQGDVPELTSLYQSIEGGIPGIQVASSAALENFSAAVIQSGAKPLSQLIEA